MKYNNSISSKPSKARSLHFNASSAQKRVLMSAALSKDLKATYKVNSAPIRKDDEVRIISGKNRDIEGKVIQVYRAKNVIYIEKVTRDNKKGEARPVGIQTSNCVITKLHLDKDRKAMLERRSLTSVPARRSPFSNDDVAM